MRREVEMNNNVDHFPINEDYDDSPSVEQQPFLSSEQKPRYRYSIEIDHQSLDLDSRKWEFPGWGVTERIELTKPPMEEDEDTDPEPPQPEETRSFLSCCKKSDPETATKKKKEQHLLGQFRATAIAGNDITSSCLYVSGLCAQAAKKLAPISLLLVVAVLYIFRGIYGEVGTALPLNGGAYNVLLNSTTKLAASIAACLTLVSYVATAVVSASSAIAYGANVWDGLCPGADPGGGSAFCWAVIFLLVAFALLNMLGLKESSTVALGIFIVHISTMCLLIVMCLVKLAIDRDFSILTDNWHKSNDDVPLQIFYGYCQALLGVSGFETSSNYIEEQKPGVFPKTLRNMWVAIAFFNPMLSFLAFCLLTEHEVLDHPNDLLAAMATKASGRWLNIIVSADAFFVLSGAVLTSYVGITGLVRRMSLDRCMPQILLRENKMGSSYLIVIIFCIVTSVLYIIVNGNVNTLAGVYTIAFLGVMSLFALGNMLLKYKRAQLHREVKTAWISVIIGFSCVVTGLIGVIVEDPVYVRFFVLYFGTTLVTVMAMFARKRVLKVAAYFLAKSKWFPGTVAILRNTIKELDEQAMVFFTKDDNLEILNKAVLYVRDNEITGKLKIVHVYEQETTIPKNLEFYIKILDRQYPKMQIDLILVKGQFNPATVNQLSNLLNVPKNFMFITCPSGRFPHNFKDLGGLRLITH